MSSPKKTQRIQKRPGRDAHNSSAPTCSALIIAFVQGAQWWEWNKEQATMWSSDRDKAETEAVRRSTNGTLGKMPN